VTEHLAKISGHKAFQPRWQVLTFESCLDFHY